MADKCPSIKRNYFGKMSERKKKTPTISTELVADCGTLLMFSSVESLLKTNR